MSFKSVRLTCWAARLRTALFEGRRWDIARKAADLRTAIVCTDRLRERTEWASWFESSFTFHLEKALKDAAAIGVRPSVVYESLKQQLMQQGSSASEAADTAKADLQRTVHEQLLTSFAHRPNHEERVRHKLSIWKLSIPLGILSRRFIQNYARLAKLVSPRVHAANWRAAWNGWCVDYRFRNMSGRSWTKPCVLGCSGTAEDRIEHYCRCPCVVHFAQKVLDIPGNRCTLPHFLLCEKGMSDAMLTCHAVLVYSVFRTTSAMRDTNPVSAEMVYDILEEHAKFTKWY